MNNYSPPIAKMRKKNSTTIILSKSNLIAEKREVKIILSDFILDIVLRGLRTLKTLKELMPLLFPPII